MRDKGNTVLVVEHDRDVIGAADHVVDVGPGAGPDGGRVVFAGDVGGLIGSDDRHRALPDRQGAAEDATSGIAAGCCRSRMPGRTTCGTSASTFPPACSPRSPGVAGAGKSSLINGAFLVQHRDAVLVDQSLPHANRRSTPITYTGIGDPIRAEFGRVNGVEPALFSANSAGACPTCAGLGMVFVDLAALDGTSLVCQTCNGRRFTDEVLGHRLRGRSIGDVLEMTVDQGREFFAGNGRRTRRVADVLAAMADVGLGYLRLGQPLTSLSGGEAQRIKLAARLRSGPATYVLDEPTAGLHMADIVRLLGVLDELVDRHGCTVLVVEHNLDVIAHADWVIELGPEGGSRGGRILYQGEPSGLLDARDSPTGRTCGWPWITPLGAA